MLKKRIFIVLVVCIVSLFSVWAVEELSVLDSAEYNFSILLGGKIDQMLPLLLETEEITEEGKEYFFLTNLIFSQVAYSFGQVYYEGEDWAYLEVSLVAPNMATIMNDAIYAILPIVYEVVMAGEDITDEEVEEILFFYMTETLLSGDFPTIEVEVGIPFERDEQGWNMIITDELLTALTGNIGSVGE